MRGSVDPRPVGLGEVVSPSLDDPFIPSVGELYLVRTEILLLPDPKSGGRWW